jgi:hypothetical protein
MLHKFRLTGRAGEPISMVSGSNDAFSPKKVPFWVSLKSCDGTGSKTPRNRLKECVVDGFPAKLEKGKKTHSSIKFIDINTKFDL